MTDYDAMDAGFGWMRNASAPPPRPGPPWDIATRADLLPGHEDTQEIRTRPRIVAMVPAHNEAADIGRTIVSLLNQSRTLDDIVIIPNGCSDDTAMIARQFPVTVLELPKLAHRKSEAMNTAWHMYAADADILVCADGDTTLPPHAVADWEKEFAADPS